MALARAEEAGWDAMMGLWARCL